MRITFVESDQVFKWTGHANRGSTVDGLAVQVPTGRCDGACLSLDQDTRHMLLHKSVKSYDVGLLYGVPFFLSYNADCMYFGGAHITSKMHM
jgi:hypothetical protein